MAGIPKYGDAQVADERLRIPEADGRVPLAALGGGEAAQQVTEQAQGLAGDVAKREFQRQAEQKNHAVNMQLLGITNQLTAEATKAKTALMQRQGKDALGGREDTLGGYSKFYENLDKNISDPDVKRIAYAHFSQHMNQLDAFASPYEQAQLRQSDNEDIQAELKINLESAATDPSPQNIAPLTMGSKLAWEEFGKRNGWTEKQIREKQQEIGSAIHFAALNSYASAGNDKAASEFFKDNEQEFIGTDKIKAQNILDGGNRDATAYRVADSVFSKPVASLEAAKKAAQEADPSAWEDPKTRKAIEGRLEHDYSKMVYDQKAAEDKLFEDSARIVRQAGTTDAIDRDTWLNKLSEHDRQRLEGALKPVREGDDYRGVTKWYAMSDEDISKMSPADMERWRGELTQKNFDKFAESWGKLRRKEDSLELKTTREDRQNVFTSLKAAGMLGLSKTDTLMTLANVKDSKKTKAFEDFWTEATDALKVAQAEKRTPLTPDEKKTIMSDLVIERAVTKAVEPWFTVGGIPVGRFLKGWVVVPDADKERINQSIRRITGSDASDETIQVLYQAQKMGASPKELQKIASGR